MQLEHYMSEEKLFNSNSAVKMVEKRCKSAQTSTKCRSIILKFGQKILCRIIDLHLVLVWADLHLFSTILTALFELNNFSSDM